MKLKPKSLSKDNFTQILGMTRLQTLYVQYIFLLHFRSRCFAFVVFKEACSVDKVFEGGDHAINSKKVDVKRAKAKPGKMFLGGLKVKLIKKSAVCLQFSMIFFFLAARIIRRRDQKTF